MPRSPFIATGVSTATAVGTVAVLTRGSSPYPPSSAVLAGFGLLLITVIAVAAYLVGRSRWARHLLVGVNLTCVGVAVATPLSPITAALIGLAATGLTLLAGPWPDRWLRKLPSADSPPPTVTAILLILVATPAVCGFTATEPVHTAVWGWAGWCVALALFLGRAVPGSLVAARFLHLPLAATVALTIGMPHGLTVLATAAAIVPLAWLREVRLSVLPLVATQRPVPFPPELVPPEILAAAGLDDRGRKLEGTP